MIPGVDTAFKTFISARFCSAIWAYISDCDETFNYWEPLHYCVYGRGLQTWEYSPEFALRSYTYLLVQGVPGWIYDQIFHPSPLLIFYLIRCILGFGCAVVERYLYKWVLIFNDNNSVLCDLFKFRCIYPAELVVEESSFNNWSCVQNFMLECQIIIIWSFYRLEKLGRN